MSATTSRGLATAAMVCLGIMLGWLSRASGQLIPPSQSRDLVAVTIHTIVSFDSNAGLYTYEYGVTNSASSPQDVTAFSVLFSGHVDAVSSPPGWAGSAITGRPIVLWGVADAGDRSPDCASDGTPPPSPFQIKPGQTLDGFSFQSPEPPGNGRYFARAVTKLPRVAGVTGGLDGPIVCSL